MTDQADGRWCRRCGEWRQPGDFESEDLNARCAPCRERTLARQRERRWAAGPAVARASNLWTKYRIKPEDYDALRTEQGHRCAICQTHEDEITHSRGGRPRADGSPPAEAFKLVVDHCHRTGRIRGLLCNGCNFLVGQARESRRIMLAAIDYLGAAPVTACATSNEVAHHTDSDQLPR